jgi:hypothetical protein
MLGPVDLEDWRDEDEETDLRARVRRCPQMQLLDRDASIAVFPGWTHFDFALARRFSTTKYLDSHELRQLAARLGV